MYQIDDVYWVNIKKLKLRITKRILIWIFTSYILIYENNEMRQLNS